MTLFRSTIILIITATSLAAPGCIMGASSGDGSAKRPSREPRGSDMAERDGPPDDFSDFSPEVSMQRDLLQLREREARQRETVENMRLALSQGREDVDREEERLQDIQLQIERYDSAMRRYEQAARAPSATDWRGGGRDYSQSRDYAGEGGGEYASRPRDRDYGRPIPERNAEYPVPANRAAPGADRYPADSGREEVLYAGGYDPRLAEQAPARDRMRPPRTQGQGQAQSRPQVSARPAARVAPRFEDELSQSDVFSVPDGLSAGAGEPMLAAAPRQKTPWPPATPAVPSPAPLRERAQPAPEREIAPPVLEDDGMDEVFTPDLFLSRR